MNEIKAWFDLIEYEDGDRPSLTDSTRIVIPVDDIDKIEEYNKSVVKVVYSSYTDSFPRTAYVMGNMDEMVICLDRACRESGVYQIRDIRQ